MIFDTTRVDGVFVVTSEIARDSRGAFERVYCTKVFAEQGLSPCTDQWSLSSNTAKGTLRGLHYQAEPHGECKLVRCVQGAVFDVAADIRPNSPTFGQVATVQLTEENGKALYIPPGVAHGFLTLQENSHILYGISPAYVAGAACGVRFDDPTLAVPWPDEPQVISDRDKGLPPLTP